jgi:hypothetical protein
MVPDAAKRSFFYGLIENQLRFVAYLAHLGGNITGFVNFELSIDGKWLKLHCASLRQNGEILPLG